MSRSEPKDVPAEEVPTAKPTYKSYKSVLSKSNDGDRSDREYRKKFLKIRHSFRERMRESNALFDDEQRATKLTRRLQEQNEYNIP